MEKPDNKRSGAGKENLYGEINRVGSVHTRMHENSKNIKLFGPRDLGVRLNCPIGK